MISSFHKCENPAELALSRSQEILNIDFNDPTAILEEEQAVAELDAVSDIFGFFGRYFVESAQAFAIPLDYDSNQPVSVSNYGGSFMFRGNLEAHSVVKISSLHISWLESMDIKALCLMFDDVLMLPYFEFLDEDRLLFVPAESIDDIQRVEEDGFTRDAGIP